MKNSFGSKVVVHTSTNSYIEVYKSFLLILSCPFESFFQSYSNKFFNS